MRLSISAVTRTAPLLSLVMLGGIAHAQGTTGVISGTVTDAGGAVVPGAQVTVTQTETNESRTVTSSGSGTYVLPQLAPGTYRVRVTAPGFGTFEQTGFVLSIDQRAEINPSLKIGTEQTTVDVSATPPAIQTEDSSVGLVIDAATIQATPLNSHTSVIGLLQLAPGVQNAGAQDQVPNRGVTPAFGSGSRNSYGGANFTLDGIRNVYITLQRPLAEIPPLDLVGQFKVITNGAAAEFNQPNQVVVVSASGTNKLHGELVEYNRGKGTSAKNYYFQNNQAPARPNYERNEFGGNVTGPIMFPHYNGHDRSFFTFGYEKFLLDQAAVKNTVQPTLAMRNGDFSAFSGGIIDPLTGLPFPNNQIPQARLSKPDLALMNLLMPLPTANTAPGAVNTSEQVPYSQSIRRYFFRLDHNINSTNQIRGTFLKAFYGPVPTVGNDSLQGGLSADGEVSTYGIVGWTHTFSPTLLLDVNLGYTHIPVFRTPQNVNTNFSAIIPGLGPQAIQGAPTINITNIQGISETGSRDLEQDMQGVASLTKIAGRHSIKTGLSYVFDNHFNVAAAGSIPGTPARGAYNFSGVYSKVAFADFLLGYPSSTQQPLPSAISYRNPSNEIGLYVQDDFKATPKLTLNYGLRYDLQVFLDNPYGTNSTWVPSLNKVVVFASQLPASTIPAYAPYVTLGTAAGLGHSLFGYLGQDKNNISPRFGFAYQPAHNTVVRGAFGIYYNLLPASYQQALAFTNFPFSAANTFTQPTGTKPTFTMDAPFSLTGATGANPTVTAVHKPVTPYTEQYNLAIEHQFPLGLDLRVGYVGQSARKQNNYGGSGNVNRDLNAVLPAPGAIQPRRPFQPFSTISYAMEPLFFSNMNALEIGLHKQLSKGLQVNAEYQFVRVLGEENFQNTFTPNDSYGPIGGITPQVFSVSYSYELPFGHGRTFAGNLNPVVDKFIGGWQISGITNAQTGQPFSVTNTTSATGGVGTTRANRVPGVPLYPSKRTKQQWFNTAAFTAPASQFTYGNSAYNLLRGPGYQDWDMSLVKNTYFGERYRVQLRAESFNIFNHPNFGTPNASVSSPGSLGTITSTTGFNRTVQFGFKFNF
ncbi:TonB-dependent receptor [Terriglobus aquaticus]|uniref:TonB-dependent receptor domain-containing protein n=1 Tax=Terriglobus aquaticus TaxID=940139 RepID=A0ABW9KSP0_9BACT|nr:TonB-dependent receptor [Terriglobus aquaticus]